MKQSATVAHRPGTGTSRRASPFRGATLRAVTRWNIILCVLALLGAVTRLTELGYPTDDGTPVFDEKHYVPQAWQILRGADNPVVGGIEDNPAYGLVVHPPLAKQLEALGMAVFGDTAFGWRVVAALLGIGVILLTASTARRIARSTGHGDWVGLSAGLIALCDGILFVTGRSAMLDQFQTFFVILAAYLLVRDHEQMEGLFRRVFTEGRVSDSPLGPRAGYRWWRFAAGVSLGCALAVKWSGLYYMAFFGLAVVGVDWWRRRRFGVQRPLAGVFALDCVPAFASLVLLPAVVYVLDWRAWFASETGVFRHEAESGNERIASWGLGWLPDSWLNFIYYHVSVLDFHEELTNSNGHHHPWESKPWDWLASTRGLLYFSETDTGGMKHVVLLTGTPAVWFLAVPVMLWGLWSLLRRRDMRWLVPVVGYLAGFLPWLVNTDRQMYLFYATNLAPFLIIGLALALGQLAGRSLVKDRDAAPQAGMVAGIRHLFLTRTGLMVGVVYLVIVVWMFLFFLPVFSGLPLTETQWRWRMWLPGWT